MGSRGLCEWSFVALRKKILPSWNMTARCEAEDIDSIDGKGDESTRNTNGSPTWRGGHTDQTSPMDGPFLGSSSTGGPNSRNSSNFYSGGNERWSGHYENSRVPPLHNQGRQDIAWSQGSPPAPIHHHHGIPGRRESNLSTGILNQWASLHSQTGNWQADPYEPSMTFVDRSRSRSNNDDNSMVMSQRRVENDGLTHGYNLGYPGHVPGNPDVGSHRLSWLIPSESSGAERLSRGPGSGGLFVPAIPLSNVQHFSATHGYQHPESQSFPSTWSNSSSLESPSSQPSYSPPHLPSYQALYTSGSGTVSGPGEEYAPIEEYGKR